MVWRSILAIIASVALANGISIYQPFDPVLDRTDRFQRHFHWSLEFPFVFSYLLYTPPGCIQPQRCPLVVALHGGYKRSLAAYFAVGAHQQDRYRSFVLMPLAASGRSWFVTPGSEKGFADGEALHSAVDIVKQVIAEHPIDEKRVYVTGSSIGGMGTFAAMARHKDLFAAGVAVNGVWPIELADNLIGSRLAVFHGTKDPFYRNVEQLITRLELSGEKPALFPMTGVGHDSQPAYRDDRLWQWLFAQRH